MAVVDWHKDTKCDVSLAPLDVGFDPRAHGMTCLIPRWARSVGYTFRWYGLDGHEEFMVARGSPEEILVTLRLAGYDVTITPPCQDCLQRDAE